MKASAYTWIIGLSALVLFGFVYIIVDQAYTDYMYPYGQSHINDTNAVIMMGVINFFWVGMPVFILFAMMIFVLINIQRRSPYE